MSDCNEPQRVSENKLEKIRQGHYNINYPIFLQLILKNQ